ncbi:kelch repeat and BTB domain-containing protein 13-like [Echeneis naucrates]|uniref:kelch repeat and BTB domain-containing protein 13-like n=1 Tax=Echeneis naucrates TaxID=173247 RepID=UPI0011137A5F|nr:kelch repeat and BTB domain-containing protein 13-like [Echeneis naucrates]
MKLGSKEMMKSSIPSCCKPPHSLRININSSSFFVDRKTLVENCEYFRALFQSGMRDSQQDEIQLQCVGVLGFLVLLRVLDGERPMLNSDQIVEAIESVTYGVWELSHSSALFIRDMYADLKEDLYTLPRNLVDYIGSLHPSSYMAVCSHSPSTELQDAQRTVCYLDEEHRDWRVLTHLPGNTSTTMAGVAVLNNRLYIIGGVHDVSKNVVEEGFCYDPTTNAWSTICGPHQLRYNFSLVGHEDYLYALGVLKHLQSLFYLSHVITQLTQVVTCYQSPTWFLAPAFGSSACNTTPRFPVTEGSDQSWTQRSLYLSGNSTGPGRSSLSSASPRDQAATRSACCSQAPGTRFCGSPALPPGRDLCGVDGAVWSAVVPAAGTAGTPAADLQPTHAATSSS